MQNFRTLGVLICALISCVENEGADSSPQGTSSDEAGTSSAATGTTGETGPTSIAGDGPCAAFVSQEDCYTGAEVEPGVFCGWRSSAFVAKDAADCSAVQLGEGCFPFPSAGGDPGCGPRPGCENSPDFAQPWFKETESGMVIIETCVGSDPINGFEPCRADGTEPLACTCVCEAAPQGD
jgi:hypothetical protein